MLRFIYSHWRLYACGAAGFVLAVVVLQVIGTRYEAGSFNNSPRIYQIDKWTGRVTICFLSSSSEFGRPSFVRCLSTDQAPAVTAPAPLRAEQSNAPKPTNIFDDIPRTAVIAGGNVSNLRPLNANPFAASSVPAERSIVRDNVTTHLPTAHSTPIERAQLEATAVTLLMIAGTIPFALITAALANALLLERASFGHKLGAYFVGLALGLVLTIAAAVTLSSFGIAPFVIRAGVSGAMLGPLIAIFRANRRSSMSLPPMKAQMP